MDKSDFFSDSEYISRTDYLNAQNDVTYSYWNTEKTAGNITDDWGTWASAKTLDPTGTLTNKEYYLISGQRNSTTARERKILKERGSINV